MFKIILLVLVFWLVYRIFFHKSLKTKKTDETSDTPKIISKPEPQEKIIKDEEGEYVDFEEVKQKPEDKTT